MHTNLRRTAAALIAAAACLGGASAGLAGETDRGKFHLGTGVHTPASPTSVRFRVLYKHPDDRAAKPPPVTAATFRLPRGMRIDTAAVPRCTADDARIRALGRAACPAASQVGTGRLTARTGVSGADPVYADIVAYNGEDEIVEVVFFEDSNVVAGIDRLSVDGTVLTAHPPSTPGGPPDGRTVVRRVFLELPERVNASGAAYATTPPRCRRGGWRARAHVEFADGGETTIPSRTRCSS
jgi:hypothetical protein